MGIFNFHDARLSLIQSAVKHVLAHGGEAQPGLAAEHPAVQDAGACLAAKEAGAPAPPKGTVDDCARLLVEYGWAWVTHNETRKKEIADEYEDSPCDPGWLTALGEYLDYYWAEGKKPQYVDVASGPTVTFPLTGSGPDGEVVVGVLGDWGTGEPVARVVLDQLFQKGPDVVVHVGDIYYSGTCEEAEHNFLAPVQAVRQARGRNVPVYTIPGNHDYYSGGEGFYRLISQLNAGLAGGAQGASFFSLVGDHWQLQAMDTGYYDHDLLKVADDITHLVPSEAAWHRSQIEAAAAAGRKVILFSHHQLFSSFLNIGATKTGNQGGLNYNPYLEQDFGDLIAAGKVAAWHWGHEHVLELYEPYRDLAFGRCVGHSAFPVLTGDDPYKVAFPAVPDSGFRLGTTDLVYDHGFVVLRLGATGGTAEYWSVPGDAVPGGPGDRSTLLFTESFG